MNGVELLKDRELKSRVSIIQPNISYAGRKVIQLLNLPPRIFLWLLKLKSGNNSHQVVTKTTSILLEGFGGSANSYLYKVFEFVSSSKEKLQLAGHTHHSAQVIQAVQWKIPVVVVIRKPMDAVCSLCARESMCDVMSSMDDKRLERHIHHLLQEYVFFYKSISHLRENIVVSDFDEVINNVNNVIAKVNEKFDKRFEYYVDKSNNKLCFGDWSPITKQGDAILKGRVIEIIRTSDKLKQIADEAISIYEFYTK